jgi:hypothetical protein
MMKKINRKPDDTIRRGMRRPLMVGFCGRCGRLLIRPSPCDAAVCDGHNPPVSVPLKPLGTTKIVIEKE